MKTIKEYPQDLIGKCFKVIQSIPTCQSLVQEGEFIFTLDFRQEDIYANMSSIKKIRDGILFLSKKDIHFHYFDDGVFTLKYFLTHLQPLDP
jgi:hypothetical protein